MFRLNDLIQERRFLNYYTGHDFQTTSLEWLQTGGPGTNGFFLDPSKDATQAFIEAMDMTLSGQDFSGYGAHGFAAYDWELGMSPTAMYYYQET